jgi:excisionase family DNA binding protein
MINGHEKLDKGMPEAAPIEPFFSIKQAAEALGLQYHQLQRGIRRGIFPAYRVGGRPRVRLSEVIAVIEAAKIGVGK